MKISRRFILLPAILFMATIIKAQTIIDFETGIVSTGYNDVQIPGDQGTRFSLKDDLKPESRMFFRLRAGYRINRHTISLLYAPLSIESNGSINRQVNFSGASFAANTPLEALYRFNSYRLTYRYDIVRKEAIEFGLGLTAKIRDAEITLKSAQEKGTKTNVGFVPILNFRVHWHVTDKFGLLLDGDALASKQGRAEDVLLAATWKFWYVFTLKAGYRILAGRN
jgi:hypothetical protein